VRWKSTAKIGLLKEKWAGPFSALPCVVGGSVDAASQAQGTALRILADDSL